MKRRVLGVILTAIMGMMVAEAVWAVPLPGTTTTEPVQSSGTTSTSTSATTQSCLAGNGGGGGASSFFGLKGWYAYLECDVTKVGDEERQTVSGSNFQKDNIAKTIWTIILTVLTDLFFIVGMVAVVMIVYGGAQYVFSAGDTGMAMKARKTTTGAIVGLVIALLAHVAVNTILGVFNG